MTQSACNRSLFKRLRERVSAHVVMEATPEMEALDRQLREQEQRMAPGLALLTILAAGLVSWGGVIILMRLVV